MKKFIVSALAGIAIEAQAQRILDFQFHDKWNTRLDQVENYGTSGTQFNFDLPGVKVIRLANGEGVLQVRKNDEPDCSVVGFDPMYSGSVWFRVDLYAWRFTGVRNEKIIFSFHYGSSLDENDKVASVEFVRQRYNKINLYGKAGGNGENIKIDDTAFWHRNDYYRFPTPWDPFPKVSTPLSIFLNINLDTGVYALHIFDWSVNDLEFLGSAKIDPNLAISGLKVTFDGNTRNKMNIFNQRDYLYIDKIIMGRTQEDVGIGDS